MIVYVSSTAKQNDTLAWFRSSITSEALLSAFDNKTAAVTRDSCSSSMSVTMEVDGDFNGTSKNYSKQSQGYVQFEKVYRAF